MYNNEKDDFYLVLPSNACLSIFPSNTLTNYVTQLPHQITLHGKYVVALVEIQIPYNFLHVAHDEIFLYCYNIDNKISEDNRKKWLPFYKISLDSKDTYELVQNTYEKNMKCEINSGMYKNEEEFINAINIAVNATFNAISQATDVNAKEVPHVQMKLINGFLHSELLCYCKDFHYVEFNKKMQRILGLDSEPLLFTDEEFVAQRTCSLRKCAPDQFFVYTDLCEPHVVGDVLTPLLRVVSADNAKLNTNIVKSFNAPQYYPLLNSNFRLVEIDIKTSTGEAVQFTSGSLTCTLHCKKVY